MRVRNAPAVTAGALTGRALAITGRAQSTATPAATRAHRHPSVRRTTPTGSAARLATASA